MKAVLDHESRVDADDRLALRLWLRLLSCTNLIEGRARKKLRGEFATTLPRFDLMAQLERHPAGLKMNDISRRMMVTGGNVTRITDQLVAEGLVTRASAPGDRRATAVRLTPAGRRSFAVMARAHEAWIVELLGGLGHKERLLLYSLLAKIKTRIIALDREAST